MNAVPLCLSALVLTAACGGSDGDAVDATPTDGPATVDAPSCVLLESLATFAPGL